ncbi:WRKY transcription factor WRKY24-like protein [Drosera capensis]
MNSSSTPFSFSTNTAMATGSFTDLLNYGDDAFIGARASSSSWGLADRIAERRGAGNVPKFKSVPPPMLPISPPAVSPSSYFAIPPGLSPSELLDSPVLLSSSNLLPSPTTGTFPAQAFHVKFDHGNFPQRKQDFTDFTFQTQSLQNGQSSSSSSSFFQSSFPAISTEQALRGQQLLQQQQQQSSWNFQLQQEQKNKQIDQYPMKSMSVQGSGTQSNQKYRVGQQTNEYSDQQYSQPAKEQRGSDGYNWKKYGQKQVKGSENPRSYYKCSFPNCPTRKNVERSSDGQITEIVYRGSHNHPKPLNPRRSSSAGAAASSFQAIQSYAPPNHAIKDEDRSPSAGQMESVETPDNSSISIVDDELDVSSNQNNRSAVENFDDNEPQAKRWKGEAEMESISGAPGGQTVREPRVVVQTPSNVEILDDGYRWRKYGQKVVKGNTNPRSYYKCTHPGCPVRKHVERAPHDVGSVITTYERKHNHDVPPARGRQAAQNTNNGSARAIDTRPSLNYSITAAGNHTLHNLSHAIPPSLEAQSSYTLETLQNPGSSTFSGFYSSMGSLVNQPQNIMDMFLNRAKEEPNEDTFRESFIY